MLARAGSSFAFSMLKDDIFIYLFMEAKHSEAYKEENNNLCSHHPELIMAALHLLLFPYFP